MEMNGDFDGSQLSLNVNSLSYAPTHNFVYQLIKIRDYIFSLTIMKEFFPKAGFDVFNPSELIDVGFTAYSNQITAILSSSPEELRTILEFLTGNRLSGSFDGEIVVDGISNRFLYKDTFAYVPKVR